MSDSVRITRHGRDDDIESVSGDLSTAYDHIRSHLLHEQARQEVVVTQAEVAAASLRRRHARAIGTVTVRQIDDADRAVRDAKVIACYIAGQLAGFPERNRDMAVMS